MILKESYQRHLDFIFFHIITLKLSFKDENGQNYKLKKKKREINFYRQRPLYY